MLLFLLDNVFFMRNGNILYDRRSKVVVSFDIRLLVVVDNWGY